MFIVKYDSFHDNVVNQKPYNWPNAYILCYDSLVISSKHPWSSASKQNMYTDIMLSILLLWKLVLLLSPGTIFCKAKWGKKKAPESNWFILGKQIAN